MEGGLENVVWSNITPDTPYTDQKNPDISGEYVVWDGVDELTNKHDVFLYHIPSQATTLLSDDTPESDQQNPSIHENKVVWEDTRLNTYVHDIVVYDIPLIRYFSRLPIAISIRSHPISTKTGLSGRANLPSGNMMPVSLRFGIDKPGLLADFSANVTAGKSPRQNVAFTEYKVQASGNSGTGILEMAIVLTSKIRFISLRFLVTYTVTLSTGNPYQRDVERKEAFISAGARPVCRFSADPYQASLPSLSISLMYLPATRKRGTGILVTGTRPMKKIR